MIVCGIHPPWSLCAILQQNFEQVSQKVIKNWQTNWHLLHDHLLKNLVQEVGKVPFSLKNSFAYSATMPVMSMHLIGRCRCNPTTSVMTENDTHASPCNSQYADKWQFVSCSIYFYTRQHALDEPFVHTLTVSDNLFVSDIADKWKVLRNIQFNTLQNLCHVIEDQDQDQDSYWWNAETTITHQDLWLGN